jgi:hypothetical protein
MDSKETVEMVETQMDRNRFTDAEREAYLKYQEVPADLPEGWLTRFEFGDAVGLISNEVHLHYSDPFWTAAFETVIAAHPRLWLNDVGRAPVVVPLVIGALVTIGNNAVDEVQEPKEAALAAKEWVEKVMIAVEAHWADPEPAKVFEVETNDEGRTLDVAGMVAHARDVLASILAKRDKRETLDARYRRMIDYKGRDYADRSIARMRELGALGPRPTLRCTIGKTTLLAKEDYTTLVEQHDFACTNPDCECAGRGAAEMPSWEDLIEDGFVEGGQVAVHVRTEETRDGNWVQVALLSSPSKVESGAFSEWLAAYNQHYGFTICEEGDAIARLETEGAA